MGLTSPEYPAEHAMGLRGILKQGELFYRHLLIEDRTVTKLY